MWMGGTWEEKRRVTHPSVSWKFTFTFFADPRSSETQIKWSMSWFLQPLNDSHNPSVPFYEHYSVFMITTLPYSIGQVWFILSSSQLFATFSLLISSEWKQRAHYESYQRHISSPTVCIKGCHCRESSPHPRGYNAVCMLAHACELR